MLWLCSYFVRVGAAAAAAAVALLLCGVLTAFEAMVLKVIIVKALKVIV